MSATTSQYAFAAASIKLYRYTSEALARAATALVPGGSLVTTFTLVASTTAPEDPDIAGPYRFGYYDASQGSGSWYRYFFQDAGGTNKSPMSDPWEADNRPSWVDRSRARSCGSEHPGGATRRAERVRRPGRLPVLGAGGLPDRHGHPARRRGAALHLKASPAGACLRAPVSRGLRESVRGCRAIGGVPHACCKGARSGTKVGRPRGRNIPLRLAG